jgi:hypothetical protein
MRSRRAPRVGQRRCDGGEGFGGDGDRYHRDGYTLRKSPPPNCGIANWTTLVSFSALRNAGRVLGESKMHLRALIAGAAFAGVSFSANAEVIERTFDITASDFELILGPDTPAPVDPVELNFTVIFNPSAVIEPTTNGLTINSFTLSNPPYSSMFSYDGGGTLTVATTTVFPNACGNPPNSYCIFIDNSAGASPTSSGGFIELTSSGGYWESQSTVVTAGPITIVPEPSTWAMMLLGFASLGFAGYRQRQKLAGAARV